jgi:hypothetical protein
MLGRLPTSVITSSDPGYATAWKWKLRWRKLFDVIGQLRRLLRDGAHVRWFLSTTKQALLLTAV